MTDERSAGTHEPGAGAHEPGAGEHEPRAGTNERTGRGDPAADGRADEPTRLAYEFTAPLWVWDARRVDTWTFVSLPDDVADEILEIAGPFARGFGSLRVEVGVGTTTWRTSIFPDSRAKTYVLPVKKAVREAEHLVPDAPVTVRLRVLGA